MLIIITLYSGKKQQLFLACIQYEKQLIDSGLMKINKDMNPHRDTLTHCLNSADLLQNREFGNHCSFRFMMGAVGELYYIALWELSNSDLHITLPKNQ